jgi:hypothetical protein
MMDAELLANLYVQLGQLHRSLRLEDVVRALEESLINLVGTEDFAVFLRDKSGRYEPLLSHGHGVPLAPFQEPAFASATWVALASGLGAPPVGIVVVASLLAHRGSVGPRERALLDALAQHAGVALEAALCAEAAGSPSCSVAALRSRIELVLGAAS